ncbi:hypothetical protein B5X24_HaOG215012 [Helicoverpa armigera]|uniref:Reverse transcriptase n=1 Tax=Helicoverpa armigera TaxID=29058 RepID=A0A2W1BCH3_HELAM|nr:hypothetical protein B5X24_HaOG215012 [Helicoverpa armigera]
MTVNADAAPPQIRSAVREWLRLPKDVPVGYFHAGTKDGGLAIPSLRTCVPDLIIKRFGRLNSSRWSVARAAARSERIQRKLRWADRQFLKFSKESPKSGKRTTAMYWHECIGGWLRIKGVSTCGRVHEVMLERCTQYTGRDFVQFVHTHVNALPSRVRNSRGRREGMLSELNCRAGCMVRETTAHTIQQCHRTHGGRIERHNCIVDVVSSAMVDKGWNVLKEPHIRTSLGLRKPDIVASRNGVGVIVDAQVVSGQRPLDELHREKRSKYGNHDELVEKVAALLNLPCKQSVRATSCTISWRGVWSLGSYKELKSLVGLDEGVFSGIPSLVLRGALTGGGWMLPAVPPPGPAVAIYPAEDQRGVIKTADDTRRTLLDAVHPGRLGLQIAGVRKVGNAGVIIQTASAAAADTLRKAVPPTLHTAEPSERQPLIALTGVDKDTSLDEVLDDLKEQNLQEEPEWTRERIEKELRLL